MTDKKYTLGIDIGSTTVKIAILDEENQLLFADYERHFANIQETLAHLLGIETREHDGASLTGHLGGVVCAVIGNHEYVDQLARIVLHLDGMDKLTDDRAFIAGTDNCSELVILLRDKLLRLAGKHHEHVIKLIRIADGKRQEDAEVEYIHERDMREELI